MPFAAWWRSDPLPELLPLPSFSAHRSADRELIERLTGLHRPLVERRLGTGHVFYVAYLETEPVAYGWAARQTGGIEELQFSFDIAPGNCYLWDFVTLPAWRGRGVYPHLLQQIVKEERDITRFWIGWEAHNTASERGIARAGFRVVGDLAVTDGRVTGFVAFQDDERAQAASTLLGLPIIERGEGGT